MKPYYELKDPEMRGTRTEANLLKHWKGKAVEKMKKTLYQQAAGREEPGYRQLAVFLGEQATNSYLHAAVFHKVLWGPYTDVEKNLEAILKQEHEDAHKTFPEYAKTAREEGFEEMARAFEAMAKVDAEQEWKYADILGKLKGGGIFAKETAQDWYCAQCGYVHHDLSAPETCPLCRGPRRFYELKGANFSTF